MDMSRVSMTSYPLIKLPLNEALQMIAEAGYSKVDVLGRMPHFSADADEQKPGQLLQAAKSKGLSVANLASYAGNGLIKDDKASQEADYEMTMRLIDIASQVGARTIRVYRVGSSNERIEHLEKTAPWYRKLAAYAETKKIYMGIENHGGVISGVPEVCREFCEAVGSPYFGVLYDPCNLLTAGADYRKGFEVMKDHIVHVHLKDGTSEHESQKKTMLGEGEIDIPWVLEQLESIGYEGDIALEYEVETVPPEEGLKVWYETFDAFVSKMK